MGFLLCWPLRDADLIQLELGFREEEEIHNFLEIEQVCLRKAGLFKKKKKKPFILYLSDFYGYPSGTPYQKAPH